MGSAVSQCHLAVARRTRRANTETGRNLRMDGRARAGGRLAVLALHDGRFVLAGPEVFYADLAVLGTAHHAATVYQYHIDLVGAWVSRESNAGSHDVSTTIVNTCTAMRLARAAAECRQPRSAPPGMSTSRGDYLQCP